MEVIRYPKQYLWVSTCRKEKTWTTIRLLDGQNCEAEIGYLLA